jgi:ATP-dependent Lon protease
METRKIKYIYSDDHDDDDEEYSDNDNNLNKKNKNKVKNSEEFNFSQKRKRSNSENDVYYKIRERSQNDEYFKKLNKNKQIEILQKEHEVYNYFQSETPIRYKILYSTLPMSTKSLIMQRIDLFESMTPYDSEYNKISKWLNSLSQIPFDNYVKMPVSLNDGQSKIQSFLYDSYKILNNTIYGQSGAKNKIMQILAQWISNPNSISQIIALEGPPGVGKTSLIKHGVSKALKRPFCFYALGGATDISNLEGHSYTYEGAICGRMVEMLMESKVMNPVIFFDELDKISDSAKGNEINGLLTHLTDSSQNNVFNDKYFSGIDIDFSKALFFFSYNSIELINPILKDRLTIVKFEGYNIEEKINIVKDFIIPDLLKNIGFLKTDIIIDSSTIEYIINKFTDNEDGVRNIKRKIEDIFLKINLLRLIDNNIKDNKINIEYKIDNLIFPLNIDNTIVNNLLLVK